MTKKKQINFVVISLLFTNALSAPTKDETAKLVREMNDILREDELLEKNHSKKEGEIHNDTEDIKQIKKENVVANDELIKAIQELDHEKKTNDEKEIDNENVKKEEDKCVDAAGLIYCYSRAMKGACNDEPDVMAAKCRRSCRLCCEDDQTIIKTEKCLTYLKTNNMCDMPDHRDKLRIICPKTCKFCGRAAAEAYCVRTKYGCCWDGSVAKDHVGTATDGCPECVDRQAREFCKRFQIDCSNRYSKSGEQIRLFCPATCQECGAHKICKDDPRMADSCFQLKHEGGCINNFHLMKFSCAKACGLCEHTTVPCENTKYGCCSDGKSIARGWFKEGCKECTDIINDSYSCEFLKKHGACIQNKDRMKNMCPATCGYCSKFHIEK